MDPTLTDLKSILEELGGSRGLWLGHSDQHGWILLDRTIENNRPGNKTEMLIFQQVSDWTELEVSRAAWDGMQGFRVYHACGLEPHEVAHLCERLREWRTRYSQRTQARLERENWLENDRRAEHILAMPYYARTREESLFLLRHKLRGRPSLEQAKIKNLIADRGIEFLVHFTSLHNLPSIIKNGLLPRGLLKSRKMAFEHNDDLRLDGLIEATSLSISFPNYQMFYKYRNQNPGKNYCVLALNPSILHELPCLFSWTNAARREINPNVEYLRPYIGAESLRAMFDSNNVYMANRRIRSDYTMDPQAEVLVLDEIPSIYIKGVAFQTPLSIPDHRNMMHINDITAAGIADLTHSHSHWFQKRPDH